MGIDDNSHQQEADDYNDDDYEESPMIPIVLMKNVIISNAIDDPHQRLICMYDYVKPMLIYIELLKTKEALNDINYPRCTFQEGKLPVNLKNNFPIIGSIGDDEFENIANIDDEDIPIDNDIIEDGIEDDDIEGLDGIIDDLESEKF
jgi:hypothetical protein